MPVIWSFKRASFSTHPAVILPFFRAAVNTAPFHNGQLLCAFEVQSHLPVPLSEHCAEQFCAKKRPIFCAKTEKRAPAGPAWSSRSNFLLKLQRNQVFSPHKREKCRICPVDKFGIYHVCVAPNSVQGRVFAPNGVCAGHICSAFSYIFPLTVRFVDDIL